MFAGRSTLD